ncbi:protein phosphatase [Bosea sp. BE125]|uniref:PP2C family protein-serine/threonine phosphatase n=1 Tax=Bosea sp. BE125 TaxID=2817909 RepID=UPI002856664C|nr:protein phosphatase 2C domain-containing protein [Bosea sp. BE125]MDR6871063.1 protein phosphatase [Bosea sp. BE125]
MDSTLPPPSMRASNDPLAMLAGALDQQASFRFETGATTDVGKVRSENEDSYIVHADAGLWCVADGMGGYEAGKLASSSVVEALRTIGQAASAADLLARFQDRVLQANIGLRKAGEERGLATFGTTVVALLIYERFFACCWAGDSRTYRVRQGQLSQISRDHTEVQDLVDQGQLTPEEAKRWPGRNIITRAIGVSDLPDLDLIQGVVEDRDVFVLCSDGLTGHVSDAEILAGVAGRAPQAACDHLVELTLARGASDNVTVIVVACEPKDAEAPVSPSPARSDADGREA